MKKSIQAYLNSTPNECRLNIEAQIARFIAPSTAVLEYPLIPSDPLTPPTEDEIAIGHSALETTPFGVILLAGGMSSRLNITGPKALYPISPVKKKPLLQLFFEHLKSCLESYDSSSIIGILIDAPSQHLFLEFLESHNWFGIEKESIHFLLQREIPYLYEGEWFLQSENKIAAAPNGNGGVFNADGITTFLEKLEKKRIPNCVILPIDNPLLFQVSPAHLGRHLLSNAEITSSGITREKEKNPMGLFAKGVQGPVIIDYPLLAQFDIPDTFSFGNINDFWSTVSFLRKCFSRSLPTHQVLKKTLRFDPISNEHTMIEAIKSESFITDLTLLASSSAALLLEREDVYAPLKTLDDTEDLQKKLLQKDKMVLIRNQISFSGEVELHPRYHYMTENQCKEALSHYPLIEGYIA